MGKRGPKPGTKSRTGGRKAGTPNRRTKELIEQLEERFPDYHPVIAMAELAMAPEPDGRTVDDYVREVRDLFRFTKLEKPMARALAAIIKRAQDTAVLQTELRFQCHKEVAPYIAPKRKALEIDPNSIPQVIVKDFTGKRE